MSIDVDKELGKIRFFDVVPNLDSLTNQEKKALMFCVEASKILGKLYLIQRCGDKLPEYIKKIEQSKDNKNLRRFFKINGGPWNNFKENEPFVEGVGEKPETAGFYPKDLTKKEWNLWLKKNPEDKKEFESIATIIRRKDGGLVAIKYSDFFKKDLKKASKLLFGASRLVNGPLKEYLYEISRALSTNDYKKSDIAWVKTTGLPFEFLFGPTEIYEDRFLGLKASFEAFIGIPDKTMTEYLETFKKHISEFDSIIAKKIKYAPKNAEGKMVVFSDVFRGGETAVGRQFSAANLPNDPEIQEQYGSKKVFSKTIMKAKSIYFISKIAERILSKEDFKNYSHDARLLFVLGHEIAHGMGPGMIKKGREKISIQKALKETYSSLEEAKADVLGFAFIKFLGKKGIFSEKQLKEIILTDFIAHFVGWRMNFKEAHAQAALMEYNYLKEGKAISYNKKQKILSINYKKAFAVYDSLANDIMVIQNEGNYNKAKRFLKTWTKIHPEMKEITEKLKDIPLEVHPVFKI